MNKCSCSVAVPCIAFFYLCAALLPHPAVLCPPALFPPKGERIEVKIINTATAACA